MTSKKLTKRERWELRRKKKSEVEQCHREHMPPQVRHLRFLKRIGAVVWDAEVKQWVPS